MRQTSTDLITPAPSADALRIIHVVSSLGVGGMERMLLQLAAAQQSAGHHVSVLAVRGGPLEEEAEARSVRAFVLHGGRLTRGVQAARYFSGVRPDIVHVHNPTSLHYAVLSKLHPKTSIIVTLHGDQNTHARLGTSFEWWFTSAAVVVSHSAVSTLRLPRVAGPLRVIHNGVYASNTGPSSADNERPGHGPLVGIMVARMDGRKGHMTLIDSVDRTINSGVDLQVLVVGDGPGRRAAEQHANQLGISANRLQFLGRRSDVDRLLGRADFFVLPSDIEGLPMAILEAMTYGLPVIASNVGGIPEVIRHEQEGLLVPPGDAAALAEAIRRLASDSVLRRRLGVAARDRVKNAFSLDRMIANYDRVYSEAMTRKRATR